MLERKPLERAEQLLHPFPDGVPTAINLAVAVEKDGGRRVEFGEVPGEIDGLDVVHVFLVECERGHGPCGGVEGASVREDVNGGGHGSLFDLAGLEDV